MVFSISQKCYIKITQYIIISRRCINYKPLGHSILITCIFTYPHLLINFQEILGNHFLA